MPTRLSRPSERTLTVGSSHREAPQLDCQVRARDPQVALSSNRDTWPAPKLDPSKPTHGGALGARSVLVESGKPCCSEDASGEHSEIGMQRWECAELRCDFSYLYTGYLSLIAEPSCVGVWGKETPLNTRHR